MQNLKASLTIPFLKKSKYSNDLTAYDIIKTLGKGTFGEVKLAIHKDT